MTDPRGAARVARTWLFVPGDRPDRFEKACASGASEVIIDLEDAVASENKASARAAVCGWLESGGSAWIRINSAATEWHTEDIEALARIEVLRGIMVSKAEEPALLSEVRSILGPRPGLVALIESAVSASALPSTLLQYPVWIGWRSGQSTSRLTSSHRVRHRMDRLDRQPGHRLLHPLM